MPIHYDRKNVDMEQLSKASVTFLHEFIVKKRRQRPSQQLLSVTEKAESQSVRLFVEPGPAGGWRLLSAGLPLVVYPPSLRPQSRGRAQVIFGGVLSYASGNLSDNLLVID